MRREITLLRPDIHVMDIDAGAHMGEQPRNSNRNRYAARFVT